MLDQRTNRELADFSVRGAGRHEAVTEIVGRADNVALVVESYVAAP
jgi:hypothetical protein